eukprot:8054299-Alexandrium_andersonii.AAC.1
MCIRDSSGGTDEREIHPVSPPAGPEASLGQFPLLLPLFQLQPLLSQVLPQHTPLRAGVPVGADDAVGAGIAVRLLLGRRPATA